MDDFGRKRPNIALVVLDTLRWDVFDKHFGWLPGLRFENAYASSHWTTPSHASMFTGLYPSEHAVHAKSKHLDHDGSVLAELLGAVGYRCRGWSANPHISRAFGFDRGFDEFRDAWATEDFSCADLYDWRTFMNEDADGGFGRYLRSLAEIVRGECATFPSIRAGLAIKLGEFGIHMGRRDVGARSVVDALEKSDFSHREFLFLNLMEAHAPYIVPDEYYDGEPLDEVPLAASFKDEPFDGSFHRQAYDACAAYLSEVYRQIFSSLTARFDVVITVSDHGHLFGEHGMWSHSYGVYPELTHVPLSVYTGEESVRTTERVVSIVDVFETVCSLADADSADRRGRSLLADEGGRPCLVEGHGLTPDNYERLLEDGVPPDTVDELDQELRGVAAPGDYYGYETDDGFVETGLLRKAEDGEALLNRLVDSLEVRKVISTDKEVPDDVQRRLEDLGYA